MQLNIDIDFTQAGRTQRMKALLDTGAEHFVVFSRGAAGKLALPQGKEAAAYGVGGNMVVGFKTQVDQVAVVGSPACTLVKVPALVLPQVTPGVDVLLGEHYLRSVDARLEMSEEGATLSCKEGPKTPIRVSAATQGIETMLVFSGIGLLVLGAITVLGRRD